MTRALKFIKFCCDEHGEGEEEVLRTPKAHRLRLRMSSAVDKIRGQLNDKWGIGHSGQIMLCCKYFESTRFSKQFSCLSASKLCRYRSVCEENAKVPGEGHAI